MTRTEIGQAVARNLGLIRGVVYKTLGKYGGNLCQADIDDIASSTSMCLLEGRLDNYNFTTEKKLQQWIGYIAMQRCIDYLRGFKKNYPLDLGVNDEHPSRLAQEIQNLAHSDDSPEVAYLEKERQAERRARLRAAVESLSQDDQEALTAMASDGYTTRAYAEQQGIKESSVYTRRHRLVKNLRKVI